MDVEIVIDQNQKEPKIIVRTDRMTDEVTKIVKKLSDETPQMIAGYAGDVLQIIDPTRLIRIFAADKKVFAETDDGELSLWLRLYEMEERLDKSVFVRISHSELINLRKVKSFDLSLAGTICVSLINGTVTYVSRRYVSKIKKTLGL